MWVLPSFDRPVGLQDVAQIAGKVPILIRLHEGDPQLEEYLAVTWPTPWNVVVGPQLRLAPTLNWAFEAYPDEPFYALMADDVHPLTAGWNEKLEEAAGSSFLAYPDDGFHHQNLCPHHCIGGDLMRAVGWWALPDLIHSFLDTAWFEIGRITNRLKYLPDVLLEHRHPIFGKGEMDDTYAFGKDAFSEDRMTFKIWAMGGGLRKAVEGVRSAGLEEISKA